MNTITWINCLLESVRKQWAEDRTAFLLSQAPLLLQNHGFSVKELLKGRKLAQAIEEEASGTIVVIRNEENPIVVGLLPADSNPTSPLSRYFRQSKNTERRSVPAAIWRGFTAPLEEGVRRYVTTAPVRFVDLLEGAAEPSGSYEIPRSLIVGESPGSADLVYGNISSWAAKNALDFSELKTKTSAAQVAPKEPQELRVWCAALADLSDIDASRILIPMDIVRKLILAEAHQKK